MLDYWLTFEHEINLFSSMGRWSITPGVMFIITRYFPIAWIISEIYGEKHYSSLRKMSLNSIPVTLGPQSVHCNVIHLF